MSIYTNYSPSTPPYNVRGPKRMPTSQDFQQQQQQQQQQPPLSPPKMATIAPIASKPENRPPINPQIPSAVPTLKVMRIQAPELCPLTCSSPSPTNAALTSSSTALSSSLILPDSFGVIHVGETFTAYLGALNTSPSLYVTNLSVVATLQTPTKRYPLAGGRDLEDEDGSKQICIEPEGGFDAIVSRGLEEVGQHILRVEVSYGCSPLEAKRRAADQASSSQMATSSTAKSLDGSSSSPPTPGDLAQSNPRKTLRKFYRFTVCSPLHVRELTRRSSESSCVVSLAVENAATPPPSSYPDSSSTASDNAASKGSSPVGGRDAGASLAAAGGLTIRSAQFHPFGVLSAYQITSPSIGGHGDRGGNIRSRNRRLGMATLSPKPKTAVEMFDECGRLEAGSSRRYLFHVSGKGGGPGESGGPGGYIGANMNEDEDEETNMLNMPTYSFHVPDISAGDELGKAVVTWTKAMGEAGRIASTYIFCPPSRVALDENTPRVARGSTRAIDRRPLSAATVASTGSTRGGAAAAGSVRNNNAKSGSAVNRAPFVVDKSGLSTDVATSLANRKPSHHHAPSEIPNQRTTPLDELYPVTVTPIDPPTTLKVNEPTRVRLRVLRHGGKEKGFDGKNLQVQFRLPEMKGIVVVGPSFTNVGDAYGAAGLGSCVVVTLVATVPGLFFVGGCYVVDLTDGSEIPQPSLFGVFVEGVNSGGNGDELVDL